MKNMMTTKEAAEKWGLHHKWVRHLCCKGLVKAEKKGNVWLIDINQKNPKQRYTP